MKKSIKSISVLVGICVVITLLLAVVNSITAPIIEKNANANANAALLELMPEGEGFEQVDLSEYTLPSTVTEVHRETTGMGYVVKAVTTGYGTDMVIMCGVTTECVVTGAVCLSSNETLGAEKTYGESFKELDADGVAAVDTVSGATKTTEAYKNAVVDALNTVLVMGGAEVETRTEEEIFADNLSAALPTESGSFTKVFLTEVVEGVDAIYMGEGGGYVCIIGEEFIGVDAEGNILSGSGANNSVVSDAIAKLKASVLTDIDTTPYADIASYVISAQITETGNYVVQTKGAGYGIKGGNEYHPASGEYIVVQVAIAPDGSIIDCITVSQAETEGLGDACANEGFYGQFAGKNEADYTEIDAISGATLTTNGYLQAIERAYLVVNTLKGEVA